MPMLNGYSIYVGAPVRVYGPWIVRVYRDSDDAHVHSAEHCPTLGVGLVEAERAIKDDLKELAA
jgi:hypothetical protein